MYRSADGGSTWNKLSDAERGLPGGERHPLGKLAVGIAASDPDRWYVLAEDTSPGFYRSDDGGDSWELVNVNHTLDERATYYTRFAIDTANADRIYFASVRFSMSLDGGHSIVEDPPRGGGDNHDIWVDPMDADRIMVTDDGGINISLNHGRSFRRIVLPIAQMYHVEVDDAVPYYVYGNRQDGYSYRGPSNSRYGFIPLGAWHGVGGCESGWATPDPSDDNIVWSGCYDGGLELYDRRTGQWRDVRVWPEASYGWTPADVKYRWHWNFPLEISPHGEHPVYVGSQYVHRTSNRGQSWQLISPDLTTNDKSRQQDSGGGLTIDNLYTWTGSVLFAIAESPLQEGVIWTGSNDGQVHVTRDGGETWANVSANVPGLYIDSWIKAIEPSMQSFVHVVREDPKRAGMLYAGTDNQIWVSLDDGSRWFPLRTNMPPVPIYWLTFQERFDDLVVATYGRGLFILDDLSPLRALTPEVLETDFLLFASRPAYRFRQVQGIHTESGSNVSGRNPPYGADINFWLSGEFADETITLTIEDPDGTVIRTLEEKGHGGINRLWWDLRHEPAREPKLRTPPPERDWVPIGEQGWRRLRTWDLDLFPGYRGPLAVPGTYTVRVKVGERELSQQLEVRKDPHSAGTLADVQEQVALWLQIRDDINVVVDMIDEIEWTRKELLDLQLRYQADLQLKSIIESADELQQYALSVEGRLFDVHLTGAREDAFRAPMKLYGRYGALGNDVGNDSADFRPTDQQRQVYDLLSQRLQATRSLYDKLMRICRPSVRSCSRKRQRRRRAVGRPGSAVRSRATRAPTAAGFASTGDGPRLGGSDPGARRRASRRPGASHEANVDRGIPAVAPRAGGRNGE